MEISERSVSHFQLEMAHLVLDLVWILHFAGDFYAKQLSVADMSYAVCLASATADRVT